MKKRQIRSQVESTANSNLLVRILIAPLGRSVRRKYKTFISLRYVCTRRRWKIASTAMPGRRANSKRPASVSREYLFHILVYVTTVAPYNDIARFTCTVLNLISRFSGVAQFARCCLARATYGSADGRDRSFGGISYVRPRFRAKKTGNGNKTRFQIKSGRPSRGPAAGVLAFSPATSTVERRNAHDAVNNTSITIVSSANTCTLIITRCTRVVVRHTTDLCMCTGSSIGLLFLGKETTIVSCSVVHTVCLAGNRCVWEMSSAHNTSRAPNTFVRLFVTRTAYTLCHA